MVIFLKCYTWLSQFALSLSIWDIGVCIDVKVFKLRGGCLAILAIE